MEKNVDVNYDDLVYDMSPESACSGWGNPRKFSWQPASGSIFEPATSRSRSVTPFDNDVRCNNV